MKNITTPRTLAECSFSVGYQTADVQRPARTDSVLNYLLAVSIGIFGALALAHWWSA